MIKVISYFGLSCLLCFVCACAHILPSFEIEQTLLQMSDTYKTKDIDAFMRFVDKDFNGNQEDLRTAVENDFVGFLSVEFVINVSEVKFDKQKGVYYAFLSYLRFAKSSRLMVENQAGDIVLTFKKDKQGFKLVDMPRPYLYGLITP